MKPMPMKIAVIGLWHLGEIYSAGLAELGHEVVGIGDDADVVANLRKNTPPLAEPQLSVLLKKHQPTGRLSYSTNLNDIKKCDVVWFALDTPIDNNDNANTDTVFHAIKKVIPHMRNNVLIVVSSQLPVGASQKVIKEIRSRRPRLLFEYAYIPENLRLGEGIKSFFNPERIVIGADNPSTIKKIQSIFQGLGADLLVMKPASAEMAKHALNSFLATSLSFTYDIADLCEYVGADIIDVAKALRTDPRIGEKAYVDANVGFSGGTLGRDLQFLMETAKKHKIQLPVIEAVRAKNAERKNIIYSRLARSLPDLKGKNIAVLGLAYKPGTSTLRRSLALEVVRGLYQKGAKLHLYDPAIKKSAVVKELAPVPFRFGSSVYDTAKNCHAVVVMTPWTALEKLKFSDIARSMKRPAVFFDTRNFFYTQEQEIKSAKLSYLGVGRS